MSSERAIHSNKQHSVVGFKQTSKALKEDQVTSLTIVKDIEIYLLAQVFSQINHKNIPTTYFESKSALGKAVGVNVNAIIVTLLNEN